MGLFREAGIAVNNPGTLASALFATYNPIGTNKWYFDSIKKPSAQGEWQVIAESSSVRFLQDENILLVFFNTGTEPFPFFTGRTGLGMHMIGPAARGLVPLKPGPVEWRVDYVKDDWIP